MTIAINPCAPLEDQLLSFAQREYEAAKSRWNDKQISDDYAYTNGSKEAYEAVIEKWARTCNAISSHYGLPRRAADRFRPYTPAELANIAKAYEHEADAATLKVHNYEDQGIPVLSHYQWLLSDAKQAKRLCNFFSYLCGVNHPYAGIDMLP